MVNVDGTLNCWKWVLSKNKCSCIQKMQLLHTTLRRFVGFHIVFRASDKMPLIHCAREDLESHKKVLKYTKLQINQIWCRYVVVNLPSGDTGRALPNAGAWGVECYTWQLPNLTQYSFIYHYCAYYHHCETTAHGSSHRLDHISGLIFTASERALTAGDIFAEQKRKK